MTLPDLFQLYRSRSCSWQWRGFLEAMSQEFSAELPAHELVILMDRIGRRFARTRRLPDCAALQDVEAEVNRRWSAEQWGECRMIEHSAHVEILHAGSPLNIALPDADWSDGFLQGVYSEWFQQLGMLAGLVVEVGRAESADLRRFVLSRAV